MFVHTSAKNSTARSAAEIVFVSTEKIGTFASFVGGE
jgi:hypothetical protein